MNARSRKIRAAAGNNEGLDAIACMLDEATAKRPSAAARTPEVVLPMGPGPVYDAVKATGRVLCEPVNKNWFGRMGKQLQQIRPDATAIATMCAWLEAGGTAGWPSPPTFEHAIVHLSKWLSYALAWDERGRQELGSRGGVGTETTVTRPVAWVK